MSIQDNCWGLYSRYLKELASVLSLIQISISHNDKDDNKSKNIIVSNTVSSSEDIDENLKELNILCIRLLEMAVSSLPSTLSSDFSIQTFDCDLNLSSIIELHTVLKNYLQEKENYFGFYNVRF